MDLRTSAIKGVKWTTAGTLVMSLFQFLQNVVMARLLRPEDFGLMAIITLILGVGLRLSDLGLTNAIIQKQKISANQYATLYGLNLLAGGILLGIFTLLSGWLAHFFELSPGFLIYLHVSFSCFLIIPLGAQYQAVLTKMLRFDLLNKINIWNALGTFMTGLLMAFKGLGLWALVGAYLFNISFQSLMCMILGWRLIPRKWHFDLRESEDLLRFGLYEMAGSFASFFSGNIDKLLIGKLIGPHALGLYTLAWNLVLFPLKKINPVLTQVAFPVFAKIQNERERLSRYYDQLMLVLMAVNIPVLLGLAVFASDFLILVYGPKWGEGARVLSLLCLVGILKSFAEPGEKIVLAKGRADAGFYWNLIWTLVVGLFILVFLAVNPSIEAVAWAQVSAWVLIGWIWHYWVAKIGEVRYKVILETMVFLALFILPLAGIQWSSTFWLEKPAWLGFGIKLAIATFIYLIMIFLFSKELLSLIKKVVKV